MAEGKTKVFFCSKFLFACWFFAVEGKVGASQVYV